MSASIDGAIRSAARWLLGRITLPLLVVGGVLLHAYTAVTAFRLAEGLIWKCTAAIAAWTTPPVAQLAVTYFAWRATGSMVNAYSFWLLAWVAVGFAAVFLAWIARRSG